LTDECTLERPPDLGRLQEVEVKEVAFQALLQNHKVATVRYGPLAPQLVLNLIFAESL
jgi:hypothetical protein